MGTPDEDVWSDIVNLPYYKDSFTKYHPTNLVEILPNLDNEGLNLLLKMLTYDPNQRISAKEALKHVNLSINLELF